MMKVTRSLVVSASFPLLLFCCQQVALQPLGRHTRTLAHVLWLLLLLLQPLLSQLRGQRSEWDGGAGGPACSGSSSVMRRTKSSFSAQPRQASPQSSRTFFSSRTLSFLRSTEVKSSCCSAGWRRRGGGVSSCFCLTSSLLTHQETHQVTHQVTT